MTTSTGDCKEIKWRIEHEIELADPTIKSCRAHAASAASHADETVIDIPAQVCSCAATRLVFGNRRRAE